MISAETGPINIEPALAIPEFLPLSINGERCSDCRAQVIPTGQFIKLKAMPCPRHEHLLEPKYQGSVSMGAIVTGESKGGA